MSIRTYIVIVLLGVLLAGTAVGAEDLDRSIKELAQRNNAFAWEFYSHLPKADDENLAFSPLGISITFAMAHGGAGGRSEAELASVLHFGAPNELFHRAFAGLVNQIRSRAANDDIQISIASGLWFEKSCGLRQGYVNLMKAYYGASICEVDFRNRPGEAVDAINGWVSEKTNGKIEGIVARESVDRFTRLIAANAVYFKGKWSNEFDDEDTEPKSFTLPDGSSIEVPTMTQRDSFWYAETPDLQVLGMMYKGEETSMLILLPRRSDGLPALERAMGSNATQSLLSSLTKCEVFVELPRFRITNRIDVGRTLAGMGMSSMFEPGEADFSRMMQSAEPLSIDQALQSVYVDVNEEGTEAAAVTYLEIAGEMGEPEERRVYHFKADHPFLFQIIENESGSILFLGRVTKPEYPGSAVAGPKEDRQPEARSGRLYVIGGGLAVLGLAVGIGALVVVRRTA